MAKVLVTGGCGYIGSHTIVDLLANNYEVISIDNYLNSFEETYQSISAISQKQFSFYKLDLCDKEATMSFFEQHQDIESIIHFAAHKSVPESVSNPLLYYENNLISTLNLMLAVQKYGVKHFVFSSSCSVYGMPTQLPVNEESPIQPCSPYAMSKYFSEQIIRDTSAIHKDCKFHLLRYFNPVGNHESALIGENPRKTYLNLVPIITRTALGILPTMMVYGQDYDTRDGTCVRDYVHVMDIARAHILSLKYLKEESGKNLDVFNLGTGTGVTTLEIIKAFEKVSNQKLDFRFGDKRPGDVESIYANYDKAKSVLGWHIRYTIEDVMKSAWEWEQRRILDKAKSN